MSEQTIARMDSDELIANADAVIAAAQERLSALCHGEPWRMSVPVRDGDSDVALGAVIRLAARLRDEYHKDRTNVPLNTLAEYIHSLNRKWWYDGDRALPRNKGELLMLVVTEIAEGFEGERKGLMDDKLPHRPMAEVELVDAIVRILDYAGAYGYDLEGALHEKLAYNASRQDHKAEAKKIATGNPLECTAKQIARSQTTGQRRAVASPEETAPNE